MKLLFRFVVGISFVTLSPAALNALQNNLCGIHLRHQAEVLHQYVDSHSGHHTVCQTKFGLTTTLAELGDANIVNGIPTIHLDSMQGKNETNLVHELYHLKLDVDGLDLTGMRFFFPQTQRTKEITLGGAQGGTFILNELSSYMQHRLFYKDMEAMGLHPYAELNSEMLSDIQKKTTPPLARDLPEILAVRLLPVLDEPLAIQQPIETWYIKMGWIRQLDAAKQIHQFVKRRNPTTKASISDAITKSLAILFPLM